MKILLYNTVNILTWIPPLSQILLINAHSIKENKPYCRKSGIGHLTSPKKSESSLTTRRCNRSLRLTIQFSDLIQTPSATILEAKLHTVKFKTQNKIIGLNSGDTQVTKNDENFGTAPRKVLCSGKLLCEKNIFPEEELCASALRKRSERSCVEINAGNSLHDVTFVPLPATEAFPQDSCTMSHQSSDSLRNWKAQLNSLNVLRCPND